MSWTFRIVGVAVGAALLAGIAMALRPPPLDVDVARAVRGPLEQKVTDDGRARVRERYTVSAPVGGTLARIDLHEGDVVEPDAVLARLLPLATPLLDPELRKTAQLRLASSIDASQQARATVARARFASEQAAHELARIESLVSEGALPGTQLDQATVDARMREAELASATFAAKVAEHEIDQARAALAHFTPGAGKSEQFEITSPVHGEVLHIFRQSEGVVSAGTALLEVGDPQALELVADVLSQDAVAIKPGMVARVVRWGGDQPLFAKVRRVEPAAFTKTSALGVDEQRVNVVLDLDGPPDRWRALGDGFAVEIEISTWTQPDVLQVPTSALFRTGEAWAVFVVRRGRATTRPVEPGHRGPLQTEIRSGLASGEIVVIHPGAALHDGARLTFR
ncbi:MAG TPA: HlyD family efflux transporter periplasmic adaptor subunit [Polyangiaceae bacterium]|nr:HlyD family efflux transporter periplasmic adaptor subunit [Polyangiaceae bacterium]